MGQQLTPVTKGQPITADGMNALIAGAITSIKGRGLVVSRQGNEVSLVVGDPGGVDTTVVVQVTSPLAGTGKYAGRIYLCNGGDDDGSTDLDNGVDLGGVEPQGCIVRNWVELFAPSGTHLFASGSVCVGRISQINADGTPVVDVNVVVCTP